MAEVAMAGFDVHEVKPDALRESRGADVVGDDLPDVAVGEDDRFVVKPRYSGFDHTPLELILRDLDVHRILLAGAATEGCVVQTAIDGRELGFKVTVLADACASPDERLEQVALTYLEEVVGALIERVSA